MTEKKNPIGWDLSDLPMRPVLPGETWQPDIRTKMPEFQERPATPEEVALAPWAFGQATDPLFPRGTLRGLSLSASLSRPIPLLCPRCLSEDVTTTTMGGINIGLTPARQMRDPNRATCESCKHQGNAGDWFAIMYWQAQLQRN